MSTNPVTTLRERVRTFNFGVQAGSPAVKVAAHAFKKPKRNFEAYGGNKELWNSVEPRVMLSGPAETGKTMALLHLVDHYAWTYPGLHATILRKVRADMGSTVLQTWEKKVIGMAPRENKTVDGIVKHGGEHPEFYIYPNDSKVWIGGLDRPGKALSGEPDLVAVNQSEELEEADWEILGSRVTGRGGVLKPGRLLGDCNPGPSTHWIMAKSAEGKLRLLKSKHEDNPTLFDQETGVITEQGILSLEALDALTGVRYKRLRKGLWVAAEGVVYDTFDGSTHIIDAPYAEIIYYIAGVDWGFSNPGVIQIWGVDRDGRMYRAWEVYHTQKLVAASQESDAWWILVAKALHEQFKIRMFVCDPSEPAYIKAFRAAGLPTAPAFNHRVLGIQNIESRLKVQADNRARLFLLRGSKAEPDPVLEKAHKPKCLEDELELYSWAKTPSGKSDKEDPVDKDNHGCDAMRYAAAYVDNIGANSKFLFA